ncbi:hypothetical protein AHYW_004380 (plasmid) [Providencia manganoxydans]
MIKILIFSVLGFYTSICFAGFNVDLSSDGKSGSAIYVGDPSNVFLL